MKTKRFTAFLMALLLSLTALSPGALAAEAQPLAAVSYTAREAKALAAPKLKSAKSVAGGVKITWSKVAGAAKYRVFRKTGGSKWQKLKDVTALAYTDKTAEPGVKYTYAVRCLSANGKVYTSKLSMGKAVTYLLTAPAIKTAANTSSGVKVTWGKVAGAAKYQVFRKTANSGWTKLKVVTGVICTDKTVQPGTEYTYAVRCLSASGKVYTSKLSAGKKVTVPLPASHDDKEDPSGGLSRSDTVYVSDSGHKIHKTSTCSGMKNYTSMSYGAALDRGYEHCKKCFP